MILAITQGACVSGWLMQNEAYEFGLKTVAFICEFESACSHKTITVQILIMCSILCRMLFRVSG